VVYSVADPDQPSGLIVNVAPNGAGFEGLIDGPRRAEIFTDMPPCA
jgi:hypothetical protein